MSDAIVMGVSGELGSFSEEAALNYLYAKKINKKVTLKYLIDMESVLNEIDGKLIDLGLFPVVNQQGGLVRMAFDAMGNYQFKVVDEFWLDVHHSLLIRRDMRLDQIKKIVSHSQAIKQCKHYLEKNFNQVQYIEALDTALAAKELSLGFYDAHTAVIAHQEAAIHYGLEVIAKNIEDIKPNLTAFIIVKNHGDQSCSV